MKKLYQDWMPAELIKIAAEGKFFSQIAADWGVASETLRDWSKDPKYPEFREAYRIARTANQAHYEDIGQKGMKGISRNFLPAIWLRIMGSHFREDWTENNTQKIELTNEVKKLSNEEIDDTIKALLASRALRKAEGNSGAPAEISE